MPFIHVLHNTHIRECINIRKNKNNLIVFADPLDGSSNIDVNVSIGTIFSIMSKNNDYILLKDHIVSIRF